MQQHDEAEAGRNEAKQDNYKKKVQMKLADGFFLFNKPKELIFEWLQDFTQCFSNSRSFLLVFFQVRKPRLDEVVVRRRRRRMQSRRHRAKTKNYM